MRISSFIISLLLCTTNLSAQELYPHNEPASSIPKGVWGVKVFGESFQEISVWRNMRALQLMYGLTPKLSILLTGTYSNHHGTTLPKDLITHTHIGNQTISYTNNIKRGIPYPYLINGVNLYAKYRFLSIDGQNKHIRAAFYGEYAFIKTVHDEAEPNLLDDTKGFGGGLIVTWLKKRFAASLTTGAIFPGSYSETQKNPNVSKPTTLIELFNGKAIKYNLSLGYLFYPKEYKNYKQANWNAYLEFQGKFYEKAKVFQDGSEIEVKSFSLKAGNYLEVYPSIQKIIHSNLRIDISVGLPLINKSYLHFYPIYCIGIQRYFYPKIKSRGVSY